MLQAHLQKSRSLAGTAHTPMGMSYQGLVAGGNLRAEWRSKARASLATRRPLLAAPLLTALLGGPRWLRLSPLHYYYTLL